MEYVSLFVFILIVVRYSWVLWDQSKVVEVS